MKWIVIFLALFALVPVHSIFAEPVEITGYVIAITDGDTLKVLTPEKQQIKIRLAEIDAPEKNQPYGNDAKKALSDLVYNKTIKILQTGVDRYDRSIATVYNGNIDINAVLVAQGAAWVYTQYSHNPKLLQLEERAKAEKKGLWALQQDQIIAPWEWRRLRKSPHNK